MQGSKYYCARQVDLWLATETPIMFASSPNSNWSVPTLQKEEREGNWRCGDAEIVRTLWPNCQWSWVSFWRTWGQGMNIYRLNIPNRFYLHWNWLAVSILRSITAKLDLLRSLKAGHYNFEQIFTSYKDCADMELKRKVGGWVVVRQSWIGVQQSRKFFKDNLFSVQHNLWWRRREIEVKLT